MQPKLSAAGRFSDINRKQTDLTVLDLKVNCLIDTGESTCYSVTV